jgi:hypothetical protein
MVIVVVVDEDRDVGLISMMARDSNAKEGTRSGCLAGALLVRLEQKLMPVLG